MSLTTTSRDSQVDLAANAIEQAKAIAPAIGARAREAEELRRMPDQTIADLIDSGLIDLMRPANRGGPEANLGALVAAVREIGKHCGSTAWTLCIYGIHTWLAGTFSDELQDEMFAGEGPVLFPGSWAPAGTATAVDGGYSITGRWAFGSGIHHSSWVSVAAVVQHEEPRKFPDVRLFLLPRGDVEVIDTWHTSGLRGTGSKDLSISGALVPERRVERFGPISRGEALLRDGEPPRYHLPLFSALALVAAAPAVGMAVGAYDDFVARVTTRTLRYSGERQSMAASAHRRIGHTGAQISAADQLLRQHVQELSATLAEGSQVSDEQRLAVRRDCAYIVESCKRAVAEMSEASGASAQFLDSPIQRHLRDISTLSTHAVYDTDAAYELAGRCALGIPAAAAMY